MIATRRFKGLPQGEVSQQQCLQKDNSMNKTQRSHAGLRFVLCTALVGALTSCTTYVDQPRSYGRYYQQPPPPVYVPPPAVQVEASFGSSGVEIRAESDFYEPLSPYGSWQVVGSYGRCWLPGRVETNWRPYCNGYWQRTDAGWYWASNEPWAWATYHYGRWDFSAQFGWYWMPQTQWAPAWVSWHEGGGYVGWAALQPSARFSGGGSVSVNVALIAPRAFVFVEPQRFLQPVRPTTVVVNNTTIINKTVNITNIKVVNNTVINEGPRTQVIEQASGKKVQAVQVRELRRNQEAEVVARQGKTPTGREKKETPVRSEVAPRDTKARVDAPSPVKASEAIALDQAQKAATDLENKKVDSQRRADEAAAKVQEEARIKAKEAETKAQEQSQKTARELEIMNRVDSERRANLAAAKAQDEARSKAKESELIAQQESQRNVKELERTTRSEAQPRGNESANKGLGKPELRPKQEQLAGQPDGTNTVKKAKKAKGKAAPPEKPPVPPASSP